VVEGSPEAQREGSYHEEEKKKKKSSAFLARESRSLRAARHPAPRDMKGEECLGEFWSNERFVPSEDEERVMRRLFKKRARKESWGKKKPPQSIKAGTRGQGTSFFMCMTKNKKREKKPNLFGR